MCVCGGGTERKRQTEKREREREGEDIQNGVCVEGGKDNFWESVCSGPVSCLTIRMLGVSWRECYWLRVHIALLLDLSQFPAPTQGSPLMNTHLVFSVVL